MWTQFFTFFSNALSDSQVLFIHVEELMIDKLTIVSGREMVWHTTIYWIYKDKPVMRPLYIFKEYSYTGYVHWTATPPTTAL